VTIQSSIVAKITQRFFKLR